MEAILSAFIEQQFKDQGDDVTVGVDDDLVLLGFDSIAYVRLVVFIRKEFGVRVPDADVTIEQFGTVANVAAYLSAKGASVGSSSEGAG